MSDESEKEVLPENVVSDNSPEDSNKTETVRSDDIMKELKEVIDKKPQDDGSIPVGLFSSEREDVEVELYLLKDTENGKLFSILPRYSPDIESLDVLGVVQQKLVAVLTSPTRAEVEKYRSDAEILSKHQPITYKDALRYLLAKHHLRAIYLEYQDEENEVHKKSISGEIDTLKLETPLDSKAETLFRNLHSTIIDFLLTSFESKSGVTL